MIDLYYDLTPNGRKIHMALEELELPYEVHWVAVKQGEQFSDEFTRINPNSKIPAIVDRDGPDGQAVRIFESGAILHYLAEKTGRLMPKDVALRWETTCWVFWQVANQGPAAGNAAHFTTYAPDAGIDEPYARERFQAETRRCCAVLDTRLAQSGTEFLVGDELTIADIACFPWTRVLKAYGIDLAEYPALQAWSTGISTRPSAKARVAEQPEGSGMPTDLTSRQYEQLFGVALAERSRSSTALASWPAHRLRPPTH